MGTTGSLKGCSIDGTNFGTMSDADLSVLSGFLIEGLATTGNTIFKKTKQVAVISGLVLDGSNALDVINLEAKMGDTKPYSLSITLADNSVYSGQGMINKSTVTTQDGNVAVDLIPQNDWTLIPA